MERLLDATDSWKFYSDNGDVAFAIHYKNVKGEKIPIFPHQRINCHVSAEKGEINCQNLASCS
jgi:hypothetical protein